MLLTNSVKALNEYNPGFWVLLSFGTYWVFHIFVFEREAGKLVG